VSRDWIDLRSDTVTRPTGAMRRAMAEAEVGDDGYGEDPTVRRLEESFADRLEKEAAVFVPSGTMGNQIALRLLGSPASAVIVGRRQHLVVYEAGAAGANSPAQLHLVDDDRGVLDPGELRARIDAAIHHQPPVSAIFVENTHMPAGGRPWPPGVLEEVAALGPPVHLDGARLFNAEVATGVPARELAAPSTTVMCCLSKGLGAPVGSLLAGSADLMTSARVERKRLGGSMRQAGVVAAAGLVALDTMVDRLADDHARAKRLAHAVAERWPDLGHDPAAAATNVVVFTHPDPAKLLHHLRRDGILAGTIDVGTVRLMTHLDVDDRAVARAVASIAAAP
jgi:threonine aldolase